MNIMISLDGVLRAETGAPIAEGVMLYRALAEHTLILATSDDRMGAEHWLRLEQLNAHIMLLTPDVSIRDVDVRAGQLRHAAGIGSRVDMLVDPSPSRCAAAMQNGITSLLFAAPKYQRPEWRPDAHRGMRPWQEIATELDHQAEQAASDSRV